MADHLSDDTPKPYRVRGSRARDKSAKTSGQTLLTRGLRVLDAKAPRIARIARGKLAASPKSALTSAVRAAVRSGSARSRNVRGAGVRGAGRHAQRVVVRARIVVPRQTSRGKSVRQHLAYIERDAVHRDGGPGELFNASGELDRSQVEAFAERGESCRHQFRIIVSPERSGDLDLPAFTRDLVRRMEHDVRSRLDYVACVHHDTDQPHVHLVVNGRDDRGGDLVISRDYIGNGLRHRAVELATNALGYRSELDVMRSLARDIGADRFTALDRRLQTLQERSPDGVIDLRNAPGSPRAALQRRLHLGRLAHLRQMGLSDELGNGVWRLEPDAMERLRGHTQHQAIQQQAQRHLAPQDRVGAIDIIDKAKLGAPITGRVLGRGLANELTGTPYLVVAGIDGKTYYAALSIHSERHLADGARRGDIVTLRRELSRATGQADRNIAALAERSDGVYDARQHIDQVRDRTLPYGATPERFVQAHVARLEALASRGVVNRESEGRYRVPADFLARLDATVAPARDTAFVKIELHTREPLERQAAARAYTWLDEQLIAGMPEQLRRAAVRNRFQDQLIDAADRRAQQLVQLGLARLDGEGLQLDPRLRHRLVLIERADAITRLSRQFGNYVDADMRAFGGRVIAVESLTTGSHAVVASGDRFALVPARHAEQLIGKDVSLVRDDTRARFRVLDALDVSPTLGPTLGR